MVGSCLTESGHSHLWRTLRKRHQVQIDIGQCSLLHYSVLIVRLILSSVPLHILQIHLKDTLHMIIYQYYLHLNILHKHVLKSTFMLVHCILATLQTLKTVELFFSLQITMILFLTYTVLTKQHFLYYITHSKQNMESTFLPSYIHSNIE